MYQGAKGQGVWLRSGKEDALRITLGIWIVKRTICMGCCRSVLAFVITDKRPTQLGLFTFPHAVRSGL